MWKANVFFFLIGVGLVLSMVFAVRSSDSFVTTKEEVQQPKENLTKPIAKINKIDKINKVSKINKINKIISPYFSTVNSEGRFGNHFFRNMYWHLLAERNNLNVEYSFQDLFLRLLGWKFHKGTKNRVSDAPTVVIKDDSMLEWLEKSIGDQEQVETDRYFFGQRREFCHLLRSYFSENNLFPEEKVAPKTVFLHVRLGDAERFNPGLDYYRTVLTGLSDLSSGHLASDTPNHPICQTLLAEFPFLQPVPDTLDEVDTIRLALKHETLILSHGSYSWLMGFLCGENGNRSIYYLDASTVTWHGDIFVFDDWNKILH